MPALDIAYSEPPLFKHPAFTTSATTLPPARLDYNWHVCYTAYLERHPTGMTASERRDSELWEEAKYNHVLTHAELAPAWLTEHSLNCTETEYLLWRSLYPANDKTPPILFPPDMPPQPAPKLTTFEEELFGVKARKPRSRKNLLTKTENQPADANSTPLPEPTQPESISYLTIGETTLSQETFGL